MFNMEKIILDTLDRKILYELDKNSRQSFQQLGKKVRLKKETVFQRIKRLQDKGVIEQFQTIVNVFALGLQNYRLLIKLKKVDESLEEEILNFFSKSKLVGWVVKIEGAWDVGVWYSTKVVSEFNREYVLFKNKYANYIHDEKLSLFTDVTYFSKSYLINEKNSIVKEIKPINEDIDISEKDYLLLELLAKNSRISIMELTGKVGLSDKTIVKSIKKLEELRIIVGYSIKINLQKIGYQHYKLHFKLDNLNKDLVKSIHSFIFFNPNITYLNNSICGYDLDLDVNVTSREELDELIVSLRRHFKNNIVNLEVLLYKKEYKQNFLN